MAREEADRTHVYLIITGGKDSFQEWGAAQAEYWIERSVGNTQFKLSSCPISTSSVWVVQETHLCSLTAL